MHRILFDISSLIHWTGPPVGISRVERELTRYGLACLENLQPVWFEPISRRYWDVDRQMAARFVNGQAVIDSLGLPDVRQKRHKSDMIPPALKPAAMWILQFRHKLLLELERVRLRGEGRTACASLAARTQEWIASPKYRRIMFNDDGTRRDWLRPDKIFLQHARLAPDTILVCAGVGWSHSDIKAIRSQKERHGFRLAILCYDIIPIQFPQFYKQHDAEAFRAYYEIAFAIADLVIFTSHRVEEDVRAFCRAEGIKLRQTGVVPLGADLSRPQLPDGALPPELQEGRYICFVSTIEPRKGHRLLYETWLKLLELGVPQATGFKLVFVGRRGWQTEDLMRDLAADERIKGSLLHYEHLDDSTMLALYRHAAFCCYPSAYEGYGLPLVEAFRHGKPVLSSTGGALPEVAGEFSPCLDPHDRDGWLNTLRKWIEDPTARAPYEQKLRHEFRHCSWNEAASLFFSCVRSNTASH